MSASHLLPNRQISFLILVALVAATLFGLLGYTSSSQSYVKVSQATCSRSQVTNTQGSKREVIKFTGTVTPRKTVRSAGVKLNLLSRDGVALIKVSRSDVDTELGTLIIGSPKHFEVAVDPKFGAFTCQVTFKDEDDYYDQIGTYKIPLN